MLRGLIEISSKDNPNTSRFLLKPNEKLVFNKRSLSAGRSGTAADPAGQHPVPTLSDIAVNSIRKDIPDSDKVETAWMYNRLVFQGDNFKELTERWNDGIM